CHPWLKNTRLFPLWYGFLSTRCVERLSVIASLHPPEGSAVIAITLQSLLTGRFLTSFPRSFLALVPILAGIAPALRANLLDPESGRPPLRDFRPTDYLGHPQIFDIIQGADGFIYLANVQGIIQYDGIRW